MDDLLDLNWSAPSSSQPSRPPSSATPAQGSFDFLSIPTSAPQSASLNDRYDRYDRSASYHSSTPARSTTPKTAPLPSSAVVGSAQPPRSGSATPAQGQSLRPFAATTNGAAVGGGGDAFSDLLSIGGNGSTGVGTGGKHLSLAERQRLLAEEKKRKEEHERAQFDHGAFWEKHGGSTSTTPVPSATMATSDTAAFGDLLTPSTKPVPAPASRTTTPIPEIVAPLPEPAALPTRSVAGSFWDSPELLSTRSQPPVKAPPSTTVSPKPSSPQPPEDPFDFDALDAATGEGRLNGISETQGSRGGTSGMRTPVSDFDFGDRDNGDEDDFLGELGKPVAPKTPQESPKLAPCSPGPSPRKSYGNRSASPPTHIVGQIVEMGFSPAQARAALARTSTGVDVQAALETLLAVQGGQRDEDHLGEEDEDRVEYERIRREEAERERRRARRAGPSRELVKPRTREEREASGAGDYAVQADKVLAQASEIGQSVFSKASSFWAAGKEKAMKVYEEQRRAYEASQAQGQGQAQGREYQAKGKVKDVRPRWMTEAKENGHGRLDDEKPSLGGFRDDEEKGSPPKQLSGPSRANGNRPHRARVEQVQRPTRDGDDRYISAKERADLLFAEEVKSSYKSPARHRTLAIPVVEASRTPRVATPVQLITRKLIDATPSQVQSSAAAKVKGNEHFKLGRFTEAETAYSTAISSLPEGHLLLVPLWNNRAATRLKLGESEGAVADCAAVIDLVGPGYHPSKETPLSGEYAEVKLGDALVKATITRAQAWEMGEKWKRAAEDWERAMAFDSILLGSTATNTRNLAADGARRAKRMLQKGEDTSQLSTEPAFKVSSTSQSAVLRSNTPADVDKSKAVSVLRKAAAAAEAENTQQLELKDRIDAKVMAWKGGKENNLRALIASLDTVLWEEVMQGAGMKVGMHELISEKQVRIRYMKVIARLHPDKLSVSNTTVEQRMLANAAFGALNDAWQAFNNS